MKQNIVEEKSKKVFGMVFYFNEAEAKSLKEFLKKPKVNLQIRKIF